MRGQCVYCGRKPETREHVPPRVFLNKPYPEQLPVVEACSDCNGGFSTHEEYLACLIECVISGSSVPEKIQNERIARILKERPSLKNRIEDARTEEDGTTVFAVELDRVRVIIEKIARGHALFEMNELLDDPVDFFANPLTTLSTEQRSDFEDIEPAALGVWPEVGSRAMQRLLVTDDAVHNGWIEVQKDRYRYSVSQIAGIEVRMVFSEYLACRVCWE